MNARELGRMLQRMADQEGGQTALAGRLGIARHHLNDVIHGRKRAGSKLLRALGLTAAVVYLPATSPRA